MRHIEKQDLSIEFDTALESLTSGIYAFSAIAKKLAARVKEVEEQEESAREMMIKAEVRSGELDHREAVLTEKETRIRERETYMNSEAQATTRKRESGELEQLCLLKTEEKKISKQTSKIKLIVGGKEFITTKSTLLQMKGSYFESLMQAGSNIRHSFTTTESFCIDRDPKHFSSVLTFLKDGKIPKGMKQDEVEELESELLYYGIIPPKKTITASFSTQQEVSSRALVHQDSNAIFEAHSVLPHVLQGCIKAWLPNQQFAMIYKATQDGFKATDFHKHCDNQGPTLTIIQSKEGHLFGGFTFESWESPANNFNKFKSHQNTFIFTLTNPHAIPPTRFFLKQGNPYSLLCCSSHCTSFGGGPDIYVSSDSHQNTPASYTKFPTSFVDHVGRGRETFTGSLYFTSKEIEVYSVKLK